MVAIKGGWAGFLICLAATGALADSPQQQMFPSPDSCYARVYSKAHLARHPDQRVTRMAIRPDRSQPAAGLAVHLTVRLRGSDGGAAESIAYCENNGSRTLYCGMEGDAGGFQITPAKGGAIQIAASSLGMTFETDTGFVTLDRNAGDDRSFLLQPVACR